MPSKGIEVKAPDVGFQVWKLEACQYGYSRYDIAKTSK